MFLCSRRLWAKETTDSRREIYSFWQRFQNKNFDQAEFFSGGIFPGSFTLFYSNGLTNLWNSFPDITYRKVHNDRKRAIFYYGQIENCQGIPLPETT